MIWHTPSPPIWNRVSRVPISPLPAVLLFLNIIFLSLVASLSQMGKDPKDSRREKFCGSPDRLQLRPPNHRTHQVGETPPVSVDFLNKYKSI